MIKTKKILLVLVMCLLLTNVAFAIAQTVDEETERGYIELIKAELGEDVKYEYGWVKSLRNTNQNIFIASIILNGEAMEVYIDMNEEVLLTTEEHLTLIEKEVDASADSDGVVFAITAITGDEDATDDEGEVSITVVDGVNRSGEEVSITTLEPKSGNDMQVYLGVVVGVLIILGVVTIIVVKKRA